MEVLFSDQAFSDLEEVREYFNEVAPFKTDEIILSIIERVLQLEEYPLSGPEEPFLKSMSLERRYLIQGNYKIIYRIIDETIYITQVFDARQDPAKLLGNEAG